MNDINQIQDPFDSSEAIADLADMLTQLEDREGLAELQLVPEFTRHRLNRACRLLPLKRQGLIRQWAIENQSRKSTAVNQAVRLTNM